MHEFTSISVSSYEADTLTALLNEKSGDGWNVVAIVPTGSTVTAYLSKEQGEESDEAKAAEPADDKPAVAPAAIAAGARLTATDESKPADESKPVIDPVPIGAAAAAADVKDAAAPDGVETDAGEPEKSPVDEPAGFAVGSSAAAAATPRRHQQRRRPRLPLRPRCRRRLLLRARHRRRHPRAGTPIRRSRYELRYWDGRSGPSTSRGPASSSPIRRSPEPASPER